MYNLYLYKVTALNRALNRALITPQTQRESDLAARGSGNQNCGFQGVCVAAVTPFVV